MKNQTKTKTKLGGKVAILGVLGVIAGLSLVVSILVDTGSALGNVNLNSYTNTPEKISTCPVGQTETSPSGGIYTTICAESPHGEKGCDVDMRDQYTCEPVNGNTLYGCCKHETTDCPSDRPQKCRGANIDGSVNNKVACCLDNERCYANVGGAPFCHAEHGCTAPKVECTGIIGDNNSYGGVTTYTTCCLPGKCYTSGVGKPSCTL